MNRIACCFIASVTLGFNPPSALAQSRTAPSLPAMGTYTQPPTVDSRTTAPRTTTQGRNPMAALGGYPQGFGNVDPRVVHRAVTRTRTIVETRMEEVPEEELKRLEIFRDAVLECRKKHDSPEAQEKARTALETLVAEQMDRDLETREQQLAEIEAQAKQLREQLEQRKSAKPEFVKLIMMMIENPAAGIGLPAEWMNAIGPASELTNVGSYGVGYRELPEASPAASGLLPPPILLQPE